MSRLSRDEIRQIAQNVKPTLADRYIAWRNPIEGLKRHQARVSLALSGGGYTGGRKNRRQTKSWQADGTDADAALVPDLEQLRDRSSDLVRNNALATGAINTTVTSVVGTGLRLQSQIDGDLLGLDPQQASQWQTRTEREFRLWANSNECDITRSQTFSGLQDLAFRSTLERGDSFALLPYVDNPGPYRLAVQLLEGDRVSSPYGSGSQKLENGNRIIEGVEITPSGTPVRYHMLKKHPGQAGAGAREWQPVNAFGSRSHRRNVLHLYRKLRIGQNRGVPFLAPVIEMFHQLGEYTDAEITAAVVSGLFSVAITTESGEGLDLSELEVETGGSSSDKDVKLASGAVFDLMPGEKVETINPGRPNSAFEPFVLAILRQIGAGLEIPFEVLIKHFTASYSASRAALLEAWRHFKVRRQWLAQQFCQPVYEAWLEDAIALGRISAPGFFDDPAIRAAWCGARWGGDGMGQLDELRAIKAARERMDTELTTLAQEKAEYDGGDWEQTIAQAGRERQARITANLPVDGNRQPGHPLDLTEQS